MISLKILTKYYDWMFVDNLLPLLTWKGPFCCHNIYLLCITFERVGQNRLIELCN
jgi:hypothetical protein